MPLRWYFFVIGPAVAVALLWLLSASMEPTPSPVRSPLHASAQSKALPGARVNAHDASASAKTTTGTGNAASTAGSGNAGSRSIAATPAAAPVPAAPAQAAAPASAAANVATDGVGSIPSATPAAPASETLAASTEMNLQPSAEAEKPAKASRSSRTASKYRQRNNNRRFAHRRYQRDPQGGGYAYYSSPYSGYGGGYRNYAGGGYGGGWGGGYGRY